MIHVEFAFLTSPVTVETVPGIPTPTVPLRRSSRSADSTSSPMLRSTPSYERSVGTRRRYSSAPVIASRARISDLVPPRSTPRRRSTFKATPSILSLWFIAIDAATLVGLLRATHADLLHTPFNSLGVQIIA